MARITLAPLVTDIRGKLGDLTFSMWKAGVNYVRSMTGVISNPQSTGQSVVRSLIAHLSKNWAGVLLEGEKTAWDTYAETEPGKGPSDGGINNMIKGNGGKMTGFNAYLLTNQWLVSAGLGQVVVAPIAAPAPTPPKTIAVSFAAGTATVVWVAPDTVVAGAICRIVGRVEGIKGHVSILATEAFDTLTKDVTTIRTAKGRRLAFTELVGKTLHVQMDTVNVTGGKSAGSNVARAIIA